MFPKRIVEAKIRGEGQLQIGQGDWSVSIQIQEIGGRFWCVYCYLLGVIFPIWNLKVHSLSKTI